MGHSSKNCPKRKHMGKICDLCNMEGHIASNCWDVVDSYAPYMKCKYCEEKKHTTAQCPFKTIMDSEYHCNESDNKQNISEKV